VCFTKSSQIFDTNRQVEGADAHSGNYNEANATPSVTTSDSQPTISTGQVAPNDVADLLKQVQRLNEPRQAISSDSVSQTQNEQLIEQSCLTQTRDVFQLFKLPRELRNKIYEYVLPHYWESPVIRPLKEEIQMGWGARGFWKIVGEQPARSLLLVNAQLAYEAGKLWYRQSTLETIVSGSGWGICAGIRSFCTSHQCKKAVYDEHHVSALTFESHSSFLFHFEVGWRKMQQLLPTIQHLVKHLNDRDNVRHIKLSFASHGTTKRAVEHVGPIIMEIVQVFHQSIKGVPSVVIDAGNRAYKGSPDRLSWLRDYCNQVALDMQVPKPMSSG